MTHRIKLLDYQYELLRRDERYKGFIGGTGTGKTFFIPIYLLYKMGTHKGKEWIVSSPSYGMLKRTVWKYVREGFKRYGISYTENKSDMTIETDDGIIYFISAETYERMQGIHAKGIIGDEAGLYDREWWDTAVQRVAFTGGEILLTTTPYSPLHWLKLEFYDRWQRGDKDFFVVNPTSLENPYYPEEEYERAKRRLPKWRFNLLFNAIFPEESDNALFNLKNLEECINLDAYQVNSINEDFEIYITVDVAREGNDESVIVIWEGYAIQDIIKIEKNNLRELESRIIQIANELQEANTDKEITIIVDATGLGIGLYENLCESNFYVIGVNFAESAYDKRKYANIRAEMYENLANAVEEKKVKLVKDDDLIEDLLAQERMYKADGRILLKSKEQIKKEIGRSTDTSDAVALRFIEVKNKVGII